MARDIDLRWKIHFPALMEEIAKNSRQPALMVPIRLLRSTVAEVAQRASELNDPIMNELMSRLALYEVADPYSPSYDAKVVKQIEKDARNAKALKDRPVPIVRRSNKRHLTADA